MRLCDQQKTAEVMVRRFHDQVMKGAEASIFISLRQGKAIGHTVRILWRNPRAEELGPTAMAGASLEAAPPAPVQASTAASQENPRQSTSETPLKCLTYRN